MIDLQTRTRYSKFLTFVSVFTLSILSTISPIFADSYPSVPDKEVTPGSLCDTPDDYRYREKIIYCNRSVSREKKREIFDLYEKEFGYSFTFANQQEREAFKIDHHIPLCAGGSNYDTNLWPQHRVIYLATDPVEQVICEELASGNILQSYAVNLIKYLKQNPREAHQVGRILRRHGKVPAY